MIVLANYVISKVWRVGIGPQPCYTVRTLTNREPSTEAGQPQFRFDVHALIFSDDAVGLETRLHQELDRQKVNLVNPRREFFYVTPHEVRDVLARIGGQYLLEYSETPEAMEWRQSTQARGPVAPLPEMQVVATPVAAPAAPPAPPVAFPSWPTGS